MSFAIETGPALRTGEQPGFERPTDRDLTETVRILAGLSRFVIADITNPRSVPLELQATVPDYMVPFVTILQRGQPAFGMFDDLPRRPLGTTVAGVQHCRNFMGRL